MGEIVAVVVGGLLALSGSLVTWRLHTSSTGSERARSDALAYHARFSSSAIRLMEEMRAYCLLPPGDRTSAHEYAVRMVGSSFNGELLCLAVIAPDPVSRAAMAFDEGLSALWNAILIAEDPWTGRIWKENQSQLANPALERYVRSVRDWLGEPALSESAFWRDSGSLALLAERQPSVRSKPLEG